MAVTEPRPAQFFASRCRTCGLVTFVSPVPAGGAANRTAEVLALASTRVSRVVAFPVSCSTRPRTFATPAFPMANVNPPQIPLPDFLNPVFSYISSCLPPPVYGALLTLFTHGLAFVSALLGLGTALISSSPSDWDAQKIVPPLITLLAAYLALASAVRTATWFVRTTAWLVKWGIIAAALSAALTWFLGAGGGGGVIASGLIAMVSDVLNGRWKDVSKGGSRSGYRHSRPRPQAWDSFERHQEWQFEEEQWNAANAASPAAQVQRFVGDALNRARDGDWLSIARGGLQSVFVHEQTEDSGGNSRER